jgi:hypothetical protein
MSDQSPSVVGGANTPSTGTPPEGGAGVMGVGKKAPRKRHTVTHKK